MTSQQQQRWFSPAQAAELVNRSVSSISAWRRTGKLPSAVKDEQGRWRYTEDDLRRVVGGVSDDQQGASSRPNSRFLDGPWAGTGRNLPPEVRRRGELRPTGSAGRYVRTDLSPVDWLWQPDILRGDSA